MFWQLFIITFDLPNSSRVPCTQRLEDVPAYRSDVLVCIDLRHLFVKGVAIVDAVRVVVCFLHLSRCDNGYYAVYRECEAVVVDNTKATEIQILYSGLV